MSNIANWPKEYESLILRCTKCSQLFNCYEDDKELFERRICPVCYIDTKYPKLVANVSGLVGLGLTVLTGCAVYTALYLLYIHLKR